MNILGVRTMPALPLASLSLLASLAAEDPAEILGDPWRPVDSDPDKPRVPNPARLAIAHLTRRFH